MKERRSVNKDFFRVKHRLSNDILNGFIHRPSLNQRAESVQLFLAQRTVKLHVKIEPPDRQYLRQNPLDTQSGLWYISLFKVFCRPFQHGQKGPELGVNAYKSRSLENCLLYLSSLN